MNTDTKQTENLAECGNKSKPLLAVVFAQWIAENHFRLHNIENGIYYWKNEEENKTTEELLNDYIRYEIDCNVKSSFINHLSK